MAVLKSPTVASTLMSLCLCQVTYRKILPNSDPLVVVAGASVSTSVIVTGCSQGSECLAGHRAYVRTACATGSNPLSRLILFTISVM